MSAIIELLNPNAYLQYNGVQFGIEDASAKSDGISYKLSHADFKVSAKDIYNSSGTAVEAIEYIIQCRGVLIADDSYAREYGLSRVRGALMESKGRLSAFGLGLDSTTGKSAIPDIDWGPRPIDFSVSSIGDISSIVNWSVKFQVAPCWDNQLNKIQPGALRSFAYSSTFSTNAEGMTVRSVSGSFSIYGSQNVVGNKLNQKQQPTPEVKGSFTDKLRAAVKIPIPKGYQRISNNWSTSENKLVTNFTIIDRQLPGEAYFPGVVKASGAWGFQSTSKVSDNPNGSPGTLPGFATTMHTLSMDLTVAPGFHPGITAVYFYQALIAKKNLIIAEIKANPVDEKQKDNVLVQATGINVVTGLFDESRTTSYSATLMVVAANKNFLYKQLWAPLPNTDYVNWKNSLKALHVTDHYGTSGLQENPHFPSVELNLCDGAETALINEKVLHDIVPTDGEWDSLFGCNEIHSEYSWLEYDIETEIVQSTDIVEHKNLFGSDTPKIGNHQQHKADYEFGINSWAETWNEIQDHMDGILKPIGGGVLNDKVRQADPLEVKGLPDVTLEVRFRGARFGVEPMVPAVASYAGVTVSELDKAVVSKEAAWAGCVVYSISAVILYKVEGTPANITLFINSPLIPNGSQHEVILKK